MMTSVAVHTTAIILRCDDFDSDILQPVQRDLRVYSSTQAWFRLEMAIGIRPRNAERENHRRHRGPEGTRLDGLRSGAYFESLDRNPDSH
ncbi:MAG: hypothetical protein ABI664_05820 [bacterium]